MPLGASTPEAVGGWGMAITAAASFVIAMVKIASGLGKDRNDGRTQSIDAALSVFKSLIDDLQAERGQLTGRLAKAEERIDELEERVQKCEDEKRGLLKAMATYADVARDLGLPLAEPGR